MPSLQRALALLLLTALGGVAARAAGPPDKVAPETQFAALQERLNQAADAALQNARQPKPQPREDRHPGPPAGTPPSAAPRPAAQARLEQLRPLVAPILRSEGIPPELIAVLRVESAGDPLALSPKGARGLWQFMPETARRYGLRVDAERDDRLDLELSTRAAARYLRDLHQRFGEWPLALAAYNAGTLQVERAVRRGGTPDFWRLSAQGLLPQETRAYVPAVLRAMPAMGLPGLEVAGSRFGRPRPQAVVYARP
ncbi:MAG TPA: lytic transglycosylase domain-containing protein [Terriglobales bacterium]|jgi:soluble lytic murein transglycosylase-like protein|nr:lytic transglycosylase domain-containing protein [Terriglobales bacterium]